VGAVTDTVSKLIAELGVTADDVHFVLVKCPLLSSDKITALRQAGLEPVTGDTYESMGGREPPARWASPWRSANAPWLSRP
jgi:cyanuric acid amidohydrolase